jgi:NADH:ubiquinone oxidoreductase subunit F (NADH-binding)
MTTAAVAAHQPVTGPPPGQRPATALPLLLPAAGAVPQDLGAHQRRHGNLPWRGASELLIADIAQAGLTGRGGAAFPVYRKLAAVAGAGGRPVVVANGAESEPASRKDTSLLWLAPHLVLDGLQLAAEAVGASQAGLYLHRGRDGRLAAVLGRALAERSAARLDRMAVEIIEAPPRFLAGQESALVNRIAGRPAVPAYTPPRVFERGVHGQPTLVQNVETLAHLALIARYGPRWFRAIGTPGEPGSMLCTIHHVDGRTGVVEAALGTPLRGLLDLDDRAQAVLVGGYHGSWLPAAEAQQLTLANAALRPLGAALGAGVLAVLPAGRCGLAEAARVTRYLAAESAGQCGPCLNGLPRIAAALTALAGPRPGLRIRADAERWAGLVTGRGACHHPDGTARFVRSALTVFGPELNRHERGECLAAADEPFLPVPVAAEGDEDRR